MITVLLISIIFQLIAVFFAFRLTYLTKQYFSWILIASAISLMALRRGISLVELINNPSVIKVNQTAEYVALVISALLAVGIILIEPLFKRIKKNELELGLKNNRLEDYNIQIKQINEELISAKEKAEESDRLKSAFLANMSHEIRTPMNGILGFADLLKEKDLSGEQQEKYINIIERSGTRMLNLINDLIDISKVESGQMEVIHSETNLNEQVEFIYSFFKPEVEKKNMQLLFNTPLSNNDAIIYSDREKIYAILTNLVKNAIKYTDTGTIEFGYKLKDEFIQFYVKDSGIGIDSDRIEAIFSRFVQADIEDVRAFQGAGLGLSISKAYVELLGGKIWVKSQVGKGSIFNFTVPKNSKKHESIELLKNKAVKEKDSNIKQLKILIVEDDESSTMLLKIALKSYCKEFIEVRNGREAIEVCKNNEDIDLILMDIKLPYLNGYEATKQIREFNKNIIIIAQTAYALDNEIKEIETAGFNGIISKPIKKDKLLDIIAKNIKN